MEWVEKADKEELKEHIIKKKYPKRKWYCTLFLFILFIYVFVASVAYIPSGIEISNLHDKIDKIGTMVCKDYGGFIIYSDFNDKKSYFVCREAKIYFDEIQGVDIK